MKFSWVIWARILFVALAVIVTFLTVKPIPDEPGDGFFFSRWISTFVFDGVIPQDKVAHFLAYAALGVAAFFTQVKLFNTQWSAPIGLATYGGLLEIVQGVSGARSMEILDAAANTLGAGAGYAGAIAVSVFFRLRSR